MVSFNAIDHFGYIYDVNDEETIKKLQQDWFLVFLLIIQTYFTDEYLIRDPNRRVNIARVFTS